MHFQNKTTVLVTRWKIPGGGVLFLARIENAGPPCLVLFSRVRPQIPGLPKHARLLVPANQIEKNNISNSLNFRPFGRRSLP